MSLQHSSCQSTTIFAPCTATASSSINTSASTITVSNSAANSSLPHGKPYTAEQIKFLLQQYPSTYSVIQNGKRNSLSCWKVFGFPARKCEISDDYERIESFTSCRLCYHTFAYTPSTGTRNMLNHSCVKNLSNSKITMFTASLSSSNQQNVDKMMNN